MTARADTSLTKDQLRKFAEAFGAGKRELIDKPRFQTQGETIEERYENLRDVAILSMEAARDGRAVFENKAVLKLAEQADIPVGLAAENLPLLQYAVARGTAAYCIECANDLRPVDSPLR